MENKQAQVIQIDPSKTQATNLWYLAFFMHRLYIALMQQIADAIAYCRIRPTRDELVQKALHELHKSWSMDFRYTSCTIDFIYNLVDKKIKEYLNSTSLSLSYPSKYMNKIPFLKKYVLIDSEYIVLPHIGRVPIGKRSDDGDDQYLWTFVESPNAVWVYFDDLPEGERKPETQAVEETKPEAAPATQEEEKTESQPTSVTITLDLGNSDNVTLSDGSTITLPKRILNHIKNVRNLDEELKTVDNDKRANNVIQRRIKTVKTLAKYLYTFMKTVIYNADKWYSTMRIDGFMFGDDDLSVRTFNGYKSQLASYARSVQRVVIFGKGESDAPAGDDEFFDTIRRIRNKISK